MYHSLEVRSPLLDQVADRRSPMWRYFDHVAVERRLALHQSSRADVHRGLWQLTGGLWRALFFYH